MVFAARFDPRLQALSRFDARTQVVLVLTKWLQLRMDHSPLYSSSPTDGHYLEVASRSYGLFSNLAPCVVVMSDNFKE